MIWGRYYQNFCSGVQALLSSYKPKVLRIEVIRDWREYSAIKEREESGRIVFVDTRGLIPIFKQKGLIQIQNNSKAIILNLNFCDSCGDVFNGCVLG